MQVFDVMTEAVVTISPEMPARLVAKLLLKHAISAAPVVAADGTILGMISEGDLLGARPEAPDGAARRDWWLELIAEGHAIPDDLRKFVESRDRPARDLMVSPVVTVDEQATVESVAGLLAAHHIKRAPVLRGTKLVGIVSRADLLRALSGQALARPMPQTEPRPPVHFQTSSPIKAAPGAPPSRPHSAADGPVVAADFRHLMDDFQQSRLRERAAVAKAKSVERAGRLAELIDHHVSESLWHGLLNRAREAAARGEHESLLLRFPSELCSDGGRAINVPEPDWPHTLRGEAAEMYRHWLDELHPSGFGLSARILDFPGGMPGDVGLYLTW